MTDDQGHFSARAQAALALANRLHGWQMRKGTNIPYVSHLLGTAALVLEYGGGETELIAALLHDAPEDCGGRPVLDAIRAQFGDDVAAIVEACTDSFEMPKPPWFDEPRPPWEPRKRAYLAALPHHSASARLVACADKLHNARTILAEYRDIGEGVWTRFSTDTEKILWYYRALADEFMARGPLQMAEELDRVVRELETATTW